MLSTFFLCNMKKKPDYSKFETAALELISRRLKEVRLEKGHTSYENLAYEMGISRSQYGAYERGQNMTITTLAKILAMLDVSFEEFFKDSKN
jgi:transcriptional regulator with XRE-family HTH domain